MKHWVVCAADYGFWGRCVFFLLFDNSRVSDLLACRFSGCVSGKIRMDCTVQSMPWDGRSIRILGHGVHSCVAPRTGCDKTRKYSLIFQTVLFLFCIKPTTSRYNALKFVKTNFKESLDERGKRNAKENVASDSECCNCRRNGSTMCCTSIDVCRR